jgi:hypothetical protein
MPKNINVRAPEYNPRPAFAYIDTLELFLPPTATPHIPKLRKAGWWLIPCIDIQGQLRGWLLILNQPKRSQIPQLDRIALDLKGVLCRLDIAIDFQHPDPVQMRRWIVQHVVLKWRRKGWMLDEDEGTNWCDRRGKRKPNRNLAVYTGRPNKITHELNCVHLELRLECAPFGGQRHAAVLTRRWAC